MSKTRRAARMAAIALVGPVLGGGAALAQAWEADPASLFGAQTRAAIHHFENFMIEATGISPQFRDAAGVAAAVRKGAAYEPQQFLAGMSLHVAQAALKDARFVEGVRDAADAMGPDALMAELAADPSMARRLPGGYEAADRAAADLGREGDALVAAGRAVKQASYDIQRQSWSTVFTDNREALLAEAKRLGGARDGRAISTSYAPSIVGARSGVVDRGLAMAAMITLGESADGARVQAISGDTKAGQCLRLAKLNYHQCLSAAGPQYEGVYCVAQHAMIEPGNCVTAASR